MTHEVNGCEVRHGAAEVEDPFEDMPVIDCSISPPRWLARRNWVQKIISFAPIRSSVIDWPDGDFHIDFCGAVSAGGAGESGPRWRRPRSEVTGTRGQGSAGPAGYRVTSETRTKCTLIPE